MNETHFLQYELNKLVSKLCWPINSSQRNILDKRGKCKPLRVTNQNWSHWMKFHFETNCFICLWCLILYIIFTLINPKFVYSQIMMNVPVPRVLTEVLAEMVKGRLAAHVLQPTKDVHVKVSFTCVAWADVVYVCPISTNGRGFQKCSCKPYIFRRCLPENDKAEDSEFFKSLFDSEFVRLVQEEQNKKCLI